MRRAGAAVPAERPFSPAYTPLPSSSLRKKSAYSDRMGTQTDVLDTEKSVVLGNTFAAGGCTSLDLTDTKGNDEIGDDSVFSLTTSVRDHYTPTVRLRELSSLDGFGNGTNLIDL